MTKKRRYLSSSEKLKALKRHLLEKVPVSEICDELGIAPSLFYTWQTKLFEHGESVFDTKRKSSPGANREQERSRLLEERLREREEALAELMSEHVALKKRSIGLV